MDTDRQSEFLTIFFYRSILNLKDAGIELIKDISSRLAENAFQHCAIVEIGMRSKRCTRSEIRPAVVLPNLTCSNAEE